MPCREFEPRHFHVDRFRDVVDAVGEFPVLAAEISAHRAWLAKLMSITEAGWPSPNSD